MVCCDAPAYATHSPLNLRFFAHKPGSERCPSVGESQDHEDLKAIAALAVNSQPGWTADVEVTGDGWRADVLAVRGSVKIAMEVQLSSQAKRETRARNDRFECSEVTPFWLRGPKNHHNDFGVGLQAAVVGNSVLEKAESVRINVVNFLGSIERQVALANGLARIIRASDGWHFKIEKQGSVPVCFELKNGEKYQQIVIAELGRSLLPTGFRPTASKQPGADQFAGAIVQLRIQGSHLPGYRSSSFQVRLNEIDKLLQAAIGPILTGEKRWRGKNHEEVVPGAFVSYREICTKCKGSFLRVTHLLIGYGRRPASFVPKVVCDDWRLFESVSEKARTLAESQGMDLVPLEAEKVFSTAKLIKQTCPYCVATAPDALVSDDEALQLWPEKEEHFRFRMAVPGKGWGPPISWIGGPERSEAIWNQLLDNRRTERDERQAEEQTLKEQEKTRKIKQREEGNRLLEEARKRRESEEEARKAEAQKQISVARQNAEVRRQGQIETERAERRSKLIKESETVFKNPAKVELWLNSGNPKLGTGPNGAAQHPIDVAAESKEGLESALQLLRKLKS